VPTDRLQLASSDPLPSQPQDDNEPEPIEIDGKAYYMVDEILEEWGRGRGKQYLVKWEGYLDPSWEPASHLKGNDALRTWRETRHK
jgi:hypothetical protein